MAGARADRYSLLRKGLDFGYPKSKLHLLLCAGFNRRFLYVAYFSYRGRR